MKSEAWFSPFRRPSLSLPQQSLVRVSLEIGRLMADRDVVIFRALGTCMYPTVRPGDILTIKPRPVSDIAVGDIAVCRRRGYLFSHRVIGKVEKNGKAYIITRPDRSSTGSDGPTFDDNLLGAVVAITRNRGQVPLEPTHYSCLINYFYKARLWLIEENERFKMRLMTAISDSEPGIFHIITARVLFMMVRSRLTYSVKVPLNETLGDAVFRRIKPDTFDTETAWNDGKIMRWTICAHINGRSEPVAWLAFVRNKDDAWMVAASHVRLRYHGTGLDRMLMSQANKILTRIR